MADTVNHIREINTNLKPISISTDAGDVFELPALSYRERIALATKLLADITDHSSSARHQAAAAGTVMRQLTTDSLSNLGAEKAEDARIERELREEAAEKAKRGAVNVGP